DVVVIKVESSTNTARSSQDVRGDGGARTVALLVEQSGDRLVPRGVKRITDVVADPGFRRKFAGQHGDVRRERQGHVRICVLEEDRVLPEPVDRRCFYLAITVRRKVIRAKGVDGDDDDRRVWITPFLLCASQEPKQSSQSTDG